MKFFKRVIGIVLVSASALLSGSVFSQVSGDGIEGTWQGTVILHPPSEGWPSSLNGCRKLGFRHHILGLEKTDSNRYRGGLIQVFVLLYSGANSCNIEGADSQGIVKQTKTWSLDARRVDNEIQVVATDGECKQQSDFCDREGVNGLFVPGAKDWQGVFYTSGNEIRDDQMATPDKPEDDFVLVRERFRDDRVNEIKPIVDGYLSDLVQGNCEDTESMVYSTVKRSGDDFRGFCANISSADITSSSVLGTYYMPSSLNDKPNGAIIQYRIRSEHNQGDMSFVVFEEDSTFKIWQILAR
ncbi:MAG: hypothetical protein U5L08_16410 [Xanthomonadales bacterium]|nr:hypothetical protein [Xanthomonadales bacterium]